MKPIVTVKKLKKLLELEVKYMQYTRKEIPKEDREQFGLSTIQLSTYKFILSCIENPNILDFAIKETEKNVHTFEVVYDFYKNKEQERNLNND